MGGVNARFEIHFLLSRRYGRPLSGAIIGGTSGFPKKPDPACVNACMSELGSDVSSTVYIGDSETDVATARNAGIPIIAMSYGYTAMPADKLGADHVIDSLSDVPEAIEALTARV